MLYKGVIETSGTAQALFSDMQAIGMPQLVVLIALPLLAGFSTGLSMAFVGISFPLLTPLIASATGINTCALLLAYTSGIVGYLASPLHLCLILSAEFFRAKLSNVYKLLLPPLLAIEAVMLLIYLLAG